MRQDSTCAAIFEDLNQVLDVDHTSIANYDILGINHSARR